MQREREREREFTQSACAAAAVGGLSDTHFGMSACVDLLPSAAAAAAAPIC